MQHPAFTKTALALTITLLAACSASQNPQENTADPVVSPAPARADKTSDASTQSTTAVSTAPIPQSGRPVSVPSQLEEAEVDMGSGAVLQAFRTGEVSMSDQVVVTGSRLVGGADVAFVRPAPGSGENYDEFRDSGIHQTALEPLSTFSIDVDTGAYSNARRFLTRGQLPPEDAVRAEEFINYFSYDYPLDNDDGAPFQVYTEVAPSPFSTGKHLVHIGIKGETMTGDEPLHSNLVFLVDVSGSMNSPDKLDLLKTSLKMLTRQLTADDSISLVVYAGASGVVLKPTPGNETARISAALDRLQAGGSTNGGAGIQLAYSLAREQFIDGGINRVILATDGDFNVGTTDFDDLIDLIEDERQTGIGLTTLGFGTGNYNDHLMEQLADAGNGNYAYIDNLNEARKVLVDEGASTLQTIAKDVKIQIEFNPAVVSEYRLIGYENRALANEDFNNDKVDAGEIGAGHTVTALYEVSLVGSESTRIDPLRYTDRDARPAPEASNTSELAFLKLRYKAPAGDRSQLIERPLLVSAMRDSVSDSSANYRFSAAVAGFAQLLRDNRHVAGFGYEEVLDLAMNARGEDPFGYRSEFINLVKTAQALSPMHQ